MRPLPISLSIVACNEEKNLRRCLGSVADLVSEIVFVDSGSTDGSLEIAKEFGATVIHKDWEGFREQKTFALEQCTQPWVLVLDADEALSPKLHASIVKFFAEKPLDSMHGGRCNRCVWFLGQWIRHGDWYPDCKLRLVRRAEAHFVGSREHDKLEVRGETVLLDGDLQHFSFPDMHSYVEKINRFAELHAERRRETNDHFSIGGSLFRPLWRFFRAYVLRAGFLDGFPGLWIAIATAFHTFIRHTRIYEEQFEDDPPKGSTYFAENPLPKKSR